MNKISTLVALDQQARFKSSINGLIAMILASTQPIDCEIHAKNEGTDFGRGFTIKDSQDNLVCRACLATEGRMLVVMCEHTPELHNQIHSSQIYELYNQLFNNTLTSNRKLNADELRVLDGFFK